MGLDWLPGNRPIPGFETEFRRTVETVLWDKVPKADLSGGTGGFWSQLLRPITVKSRPTPRDSDALRVRYEEISVSAFETLNAPRVGFDANADDWATNKHASRKIAKPLDAWLKEMHGYYVVDLVPPSDGIPLYSNGGGASYLERFSFRAQFLKSCVPIIGKELLYASYEVKFAPDLSAFGAQLVANANAYAQENNLEIPTVPPDDIKSIAAQLHIVVAAGRWCLFWAERGHFLEPHF